MVVLGVVKSFQRCNFRRNLAEACRRQFELIRSPGIKCGAVLCMVGSVDGRAILAADVVTLTHALGGVVAFPKNLEQLRVTDGGRVVNDQHDFGMAGIAIANSPIVGTCNMATGISCGGRKYAVDLPKTSFCTPETAQRKYSLPQVFGKRSLHRVAIHEMLVQSRCACFFHCSGFSIEPGSGRRAAVQ